MEDTLKIFLAGAKKVADIQRITQKDIAKAVGSKQGTISSYFIGRTKPTDDMIHRISTMALNSTYQEILDIGRAELKITNPAPPIDTTGSDPLGDYNNLKLTLEIARDHIESLKFIIETLKKENAELKNRWSDGTSLGGARTTNQKTG